MKRPRFSLASVKLPSTSRYERIYPVNGPGATIGLQLTSEQAAQLGLALLIASQNWQTVDLTAYRATNRVAVTARPTAAAPALRNWPPDPHYISEPEAWRIFQAGAPKR